MVEDYQSLGQDLVEEDRSFGEAAVDAPGRSQIVPYTGYTVDCSS